MLGECTVINNKLKKEDLVSIIIPAYNCEDFIGQTFDSVMNQTYQNWEAIVVDDCSTDNTAKIIKEYERKDNRIKYYRLEKNSGAAIARNKAVDIASGIYMAFLDSDDVWFPEKLSKQIYFMENNAYYFTCTSYTKIDEEGKSLNKTIFAKDKLDYYGVLKECPGNSTVIYNADKLGKFKIPNIKKRNDFVMWLQVIKEAKYLYGIKEPLGSHRVRRGSLSENKIDLVRYQWQVYRKIERLPLLKSIYLILHKGLTTIFS